MTAKMQSQWFLAQKLFKVLPRCQCFGQSDLFSGHFRSLFYLVIFLFKIQYLQYIGVFTVGDYLEEGGGESKTDVDIVFIGLKYFLHGLVLLGYFCF